MFIKHLYLFLNKKIQLIVNHKTQKIHIIGAGVSGLIAATVLENNRYHPIILESTDRIGGRVKTDCIQNFNLDHGFQVLLTSYLFAQKYLDYKSLELEEFLPGAILFKNKKKITIGDPLRNLSFLFPTLLAPIGSVSDKFKILKLTNRLKRKKISEIFSEPELTTFEYLKKNGFSNQIIDDFFRPFFGGIYLEDELSTSSRMFEFVYKMFSKGKAAIPNNGIAAIPNQLKSKLKNTQFNFNTVVEAVKTNEIKLKDFSTIKSDFTIITSGASSLISNLSGSSIKWKSCQTLYFLTPERIIRKNLIGLSSISNSLINNIHYSKKIDQISEAEKYLLSVTVIKKHHLSDLVLIESVKKELIEIFGIYKTKFLKLYNIKKALPDLNKIQYEMQPSETQILPGIYLAGDEQLNGSLNAAMISGERAALAVIESITNIKR